MVRSETTCSNKYSLRRTPQRTRAEVETFNRLRLVTEARLSLLPRASSKCSGHQLPKPRPLPSCQSASKTLKHQPVGQRVACSTTSSASSNRTLLFRRPARCSRTPLSSSSTRPSVTTSLQTPLRRVVSVCKLRRCPHLKPLSAGLRTAVSASSSFSSIMEAVQPIGTPQVWRPHRKCSQRPLLGAANTVPDLRASFIRLHLLSHSTVSHSSSSQPRLSRCLQLVTRKL